MKIDLKMIVGFDEFIKLNSGDVFEIAEYTPSHDYGPYMKCHGAVDCVNLQSGYTFNFSKEFSHESIKIRKVKAKLVREE